MNSTQVSAELIEAYRGAEYRIGTGGRAFSIWVGARSTPLASLLELSGVDGGGFITAANPRSMLWHPGANCAAHEQLRAALTPLAMRLIEAEGLDPAGDWPPEPGFLALGLSRPELILIGREFGQNAVVWTGAEAVPELVLLR